MHRVLRIAGVVALTGCAATAAPTTSPGPSSPRRPTPATDHPPGTSAPPAPAVDAAPAVASPFTVALETDTSDLDLHAVGSVAIVVTGVYDTERAHLLDASGLREDPRLRAGIEGLPDHPLAFSLGPMRGSWPDLQVSVNLPGERGGDWVEYAWAGDRWRKLPPAQQDQPNWSREYSGAYYQGGLLAFGPDGLYEKAHWDDADEMMPLLGWVDGRKKKPLPVLAKPDAAHAKVCKARMRRHFDIEATPDGGLVAVGITCGDREMAIERWAPGWRTSTVTVLPGGTNPHGHEGYLSGLEPKVFVHGEDVLVVGSREEPKEGSADPRLRPYVARIRRGAVEVLTPTAAGAPLLGAQVSTDGTVAFFERQWFHGRGPSDAKWSVSELPAPIEGLSRAPDGAWWVILKDGRVARRGAGDASFEVRVFPTRKDGRHYSARTMQWLASGETLIEASIAEEHGDAVRGSALLREKREGSAAPRIEKIPEPKLRVGTTRPLGPGCKEPLAVLFAMSKIAPDDYDFPATRKALKGQLRFRGTELLVGRDAGRRYLVAKPPSIAIGRELVALIEKQVPSSRPQLVCGRPAAIVRPFRLDLGTGELVK